jgi:bifunctional non-homologous end joining protein LigD
LVFRTSPTVTKAATATSNCLSRSASSDRAFQRKKPAAIGFKAPYPGFVEPALASSIEKVPSGERWVHEIKFDGYRVQLHVAHEDIKVFTRRGHDWTRRFKKIGTDA